MSILGKNVGRTDGGGGKKIIACCLRQRYLLPPHGHGCIWASHSNKLKVQQFDDIGAVDVDGQPFRQILIYSQQDLTTCMLMKKLHSYNSRQLFGLTGETKDGKGTKDCTAYYHRPFLKPVPPYEDDDHPNEFWEIITQ